MSDYRRLISYIYAYEGGVKGRNIGFAKLEARGGQCKIQVSVRKIYVGSQDTGVYLLTGDSEIMLGKIFLRGGSGEFRTVVLFDNVNGSGKGMDVCYGLTIHSVDDTWRCYTTIWEDAVAHAAALELEEATSANAEAREMEHMPASVITEKSLEVIDAAPRESVAESIEREIREQELAENLGREVRRQQEISQQPARDIQQPVSDTQQQLSGMQQPISDTQQPVSDTQQQLSDTQQPVPDTQKPVPDMQQPAAEIPIPAQAAEPDRETAGHLWTHFRRHYPKIQAFDYQGGCEILLIKPQDIGLLPREIWSYGNNSFLLHGYYSHRYLILARLAAPGGNVRFLLGVPGHYYSNEKYMASMFGFPNFVLSKMQPAGDGRFGYWYTDIRLPEENAG